MIKCGQEIWIEWEESENPTDEEDKELEGRFAQVEDLATKLGFKMIWGEVFPDIDGDML